MNTQIRYGLIYVCVTFVVLIFLNIYTSGTSQKLFYQSKKASMIEKCQLAASRIADIDVLNFTTAEEAVGKMDSLKVSRLIITNQDGMAVYDSLSDNSAVGQYVLLPEIVKALDGSGSNVFTWDYHDGTMKSRAATPVLSYGTFIGCVYMMEYDTEQGALIRSLQQNVLTVTLILETVVILFSIFFSNAFSKRFRSIFASMRIIREGDYSHKVSLGGHDELAFLGDEFNALTEKLQASESKRSQFVSDASHELKTPMTSIGGFIDGILDGTIPPEDEKKYLKIVSNEVKRLSRMVVSMLNLSKIEAGEISINLSTYDIAKQIFEILLSFEQKIDEGRINIIGFENMGIVFARADKDLLQQVLYNLIDNAVKFTPENGSIELYAENDSEKTTVRIRNSGHGISPDEISRIFERFYKVDKSRSYDTKGTGLGLYIVKTIINMHDGEISADSIQGKYTEFRFTIPYTS